MRLVVTLESVRGRRIHSDYQGPRAMNFYLTNPSTGRVIESCRPRENESVTGKIVIFPARKGSSAVQIGGFCQLKPSGNLPPGFIRMLDLVLVPAAFLGEVALATGVGRISPS